MTPCEKIRGGFICYTHAYQFKGYFFELRWGEPIPLKKDGDPSMRTPAGFWDAMDEFLELTETECEQYVAW